MPRLDNSADLLQQQNKHDMTNKKRHRRSGPIALELTQRMRSLRSAMNLAKFRAFLEENDKSDSSRTANMKPEFPPSNVILTEWGVDLIVSAANPSNAILRQSENRNICI